MHTQQGALFAGVEPKPALARPRETTYIYETKGRAREYRELACNLYTGCDHRCTYCYAPDVLKRDRQQFDEPQPRTDILRKLEQDAAVRESIGETRQILFCFACDPYQSLDVRYAITRSAIETCHRHDLPVCTLTKGGRRALRDLDLFTPRDSFASTLTCIGDMESQKWEPGAALPQDRIDTLARFHSAGIPTWVSLEPVLDPSWTFELIRRSHEVVDEFKVGKLNYHARAQEIDWPRFTRSAVELLERLGCHYYLKEDIRRYA